MKKLAADNTRPPKSKAVVMHGRHQAREQDLNEGGSTDASVFLTIQSLMQKITVRLVLQIGYRNVEDSSIVALSRLTYGSLWITSLHCRFLVTINEFVCRPANSELKYCELLRSLPHEEINGSIRGSTGG
jgi:hypothetical protein